MAIQNDIISPHREEFEAAMRNIGIGGLSVAALIDLAHLISASPLEKREIDLRINQIFEGKAFAKHEVDLVIEACRGASPNFRQALQGVLPPEHRRSLYRTLNESAITGATPKVSLAPIKSTMETPSVAELKGEGRTVILLATGQQDANSNLLRANEFTPISILTVSELNNLLSRDTPVCGIVIDGSWWSLISEDGHIQFIERLLSYSSFYFLKVDETLLNPSAGGRLHALCQEHRFRKAESTELSGSRSSHLGASDIEALQDAARALAAYVEARIYPADITDRESLVLLAALQKRNSGKSPFQPIRIERVGASMIRSGRSQAKVILLRSDLNGATLIAKVSTSDDLRNEMIRFKTFIEPWDNRVAPELHVQGSTGAILFALVDANGDANAPAPSLGERIYELDATERGALSNNATLLPDLKEVITRTTKRLSALNKKSAGDSKIDNRCWLNASPLESLEKNGVHYELIDGGAVIDLTKHLNEAQARAHTLDGRATIHGDVHLGNILVRNDREPAFVDFALSGPGHPCFDLARLEAAILYPNLRQVGSEESLTSVFADVFNCELSLDEMMARHPCFCSSKVSQLALHASIEVKAQAKEVLNVYGGEMKDLLSVRLIIAGQCLALPSQNQTSVVRASIRALIRGLTHSSEPR